MKHLYEYNNLKLTNSLFNRLTYWYDQMSTDIELVKDIFLKTDIILDYPEEEDLPECSIVKFVKYKNIILYSTSVEAMGGIHHDDLAKLLKVSILNPDVYHGTFGITTFISTGNFDKKFIDEIIDKYNKNIKKHIYLKDLSQIDKNNLTINVDIIRHNNIGGYYKYSDFKKANISNYAYRLLFLFQNNLEKLSNIPRDKYKEIFPSMRNGEEYSVHDEIQKFIKNPKNIKYIKMSKGVSTAEYKHLTTKYRFTESNES